MSKDEKEEIIEEAEEQETSLDSEDEDELEITEDSEESEILEIESTDETKEESLEAEPIEEEEEIPKLEDVEDVEELEISEEIPEEPIEIVSEDVEEEISMEEPEIPEVPLEVKADEIVEEKEPAGEEDIDEYGFEIEDVKAEKPVKPKKKRTYFGLSIIIGLVITLAIEAAFSIPLWLQGASRPDLYYIELVLVLITLMIPGLITRSLQKGILGAFIIFVISFALPTILAVFDFQILSNPLAPLFASTDFALPAFDVFIDLFPNLADLPFAQIQKWIWIVDMFIMFIIVLLVVTFGTALIKNVTKPKKKVGNWIGIPLLSIGLIIFAIFTPIIFSSTYGIVQASTSFLAGTTTMQNAYGSFESGDLQTLDIELIQDELAKANNWLNISQANYNGLQNIGIIAIASLVAGQYAPLIEAGDQLALATLALTGVLFPLFSGIYDLTRSLKNATDDMANFGQEQDLIPSDLKSILFAKQDITSIEELKASLENSINTMEAARDVLVLVEEKISEADISGAFDEVKATLKELLETNDFLPAITNIIEEILDKLENIDEQLIGFEEFISFTVDNINPTISILWTCYNSIVGNDHMKHYRFTEAKSSFLQAIGNISSISLVTYTPPPELGGVFSVDITEDFSLLLEDLLALLDPLLHEEYAFATTYESIFNIVSILNVEPLDNPLTYDLINPHIIDANNTAAQTLANGTLAQVELWVFRNNTAINAYGTSFTEIGINFDNILTKDFKPQQFGVFTNDMKNVYSGLVESLRQYFLIINLDDARTSISLSEATITSIITGPTIDADYMDNYLNNWSLIITNIRAKMDIGLGQDITTEINSLFTAIEAK